MSVQFRVMIVVALWMGIVLVCYAVWRRYQRHGEAIDRLQREMARSDSPEMDESRIGWLKRRMMLAGYGAPAAGTLLVVLTIVMLVGGILCALLFRWSGLQRVFLEGIESVPGGLSGMLAPVVIVSPWLIAVMVTALPILVVRASRRSRIAQVSRDLPLAMDLWATLSEGGLGFDAALDRWQRTQRPDRVLASACRGFQRDLLGGMRRSVAFRRLAGRLEVPSLTRFTAAMIQSEQMGASVSETLRLQAEDVRAERREKSMAFAQSLATKRVVPLVVCFLPGLFVWPLGPFFTQLLRIVDSLTGGGGS
ncbi:type II secretion system F family protein [Novipirellula artificiosorum]|uniref:Bacterial type II secretion system protein F domain protein n=1 Tax=Novipirellula artificiosorum TaxID=2528016 RepID=A0A5C6D1S4_9BACT|nr:type II secretion system F family protein [Novipirellula artificiosorum]TWU31133.1 Bacterial type II secretion system protein F domain protein [Novipirellula artificiosorum]